MTATLDRGVGTEAPKRRDRPARKQLQPGWPLFALFGGYPLWWVLGIGEFACLLFAIPMAAELIRAGHVRAPRGLGVWLLFIVWVAGGVFVLQVHAPGTVATDSTTRYLTFGYRLLWYVAATVMLLYVGNTRKQVSNHRVALALGYMFVVVTAGGLLGVLAPHLEFRSAMEYVLPGGLRSNGFVHGLIHPVTAQVQSFLGYDEARPSAPFAFTNEWGLAMACFLPFFLITWCRRDSGWRRFVAPVVLLLAMVSIVFSLNRGLWLALSTAALFVAVRYAIMGRARILAALGGAVLLVGAIIAVSPLGSLILDRLAHPDSNQGRTNLGSLTTSSVLQGSPIMGFGSTRNVQGNFSSIAVAASAHCPGCSPPPLGTQGHLWLVLFSQGIVGLVLYLAFFISQLVRNLRLESPYVVASLSVLVIHLVTMPVYDSIGPSLFAIMASVGLLWRAAVERDEGPVDTARRKPRLGPTEVPFRSYFASARRHAVSLAVLAIVGAFVGGLYQTARGTPSVATQSILLPAAPPSKGSSPVTVDTDAQLVTSDQVLEAVAEVEPARLTRTDIESRLAITASPNTSILHLAFSADTPADAVRGVQAATKAYLGIYDQLVPGTTISNQPGQVVSAATVTRSHDSRIVSSASGLMLALCGGLVYWLLFGDAHARVRRPRTIRSVTGLPVLAELRVGRSGDPGAGELAEAQQAIRHRMATSVVAIPRSTAARKIAWLLDSSLPSHTGQTHDTVIVVSKRTRVGDLTQLQNAVTRSGQRVVGYVLAAGR